MRRTHGLTAARRGAVVVVVDATRKLEDQFNALFVFEQLERSGSPAPICRSDPIVATLT